MFNSDNDSQLEPLGVQVFREAYSLRKKLVGMDERAQLLRDRDEFICKSLESLDSDSGFSYYLCSEWARVLYTNYPRGIAATYPHSLAALYLLVGLIQHKNLREFHAKGISFVLSEYYVFHVEVLRAIEVGSLSNEIAEKIINYIDHNMSFEITDPCFMFLLDTKKLSSVLWQQILDLNNGKYDLSNYRENRNSVCFEIHADIKKLYFGI